MALALTLIVGLAALTGGLVKAAGAKSPVVVMTRPVPAGHLIVRSDLSTIDVAGGLTAIKGADLNEVVGQWTSVAVRTGTPMQRSMLSSAGSVRPGQAQVGVSVTSAQIPSDVVQPGDTVEVLQVRDPDAGDTAASGDSAQILVPSATVWSARDDSQSGRVLLTLTIPQNAVDEVVAASDAGKIALAKVSS